MEVRAGNRTLHQVLPDPALCRRMRELVRACNLDPLFEANGCMILDGTRPPGAAGEAGGPAYGCKKEFP